MNKVQTKPFNAQDSEISGRIYADQLNLLYRSLNVSMLVSIALALLWLFLVDSFIHTANPYWWFAGFVVIALLRVLSTQAYRRHYQRYSCRFWELLFLSGVVSSAAMWALAVAWVFPIMDTEHQAFLLLFLAGLHMGALSTAAARPLPMPLFVIITLAPLIWYWFGESNRLPDTVLIMFLFYLLVIGSNAHRLFQVSQHNFRLSHEAARSEKRFRSIVDSAGDALLVVDQMGIIVDANKTACDLTGYTRQQLLGMPFKSVSGSVDKEFETLLQRLKVGEVVVETSEFRNQSTQTFPVNVSQSLYEIGGESYVVVLARDLTMQQQRELELKKSKTKLDLHVSQTPLAVIEWDSDFKVIAWNGGAEKIFGFGASEIIGKHAYETIVDEADKELVREIWRQLMSNSGGHRSVNQNITKSGNIITCDWYNTSLVDGNGQVVGVASMVMDISEQISSQKALYEAKLKAEAANATKTEFLSRMSHELRTPLNAIIGFSNLLRKEHANEEYVNAIELSGQHLLAMIDEILDLSRLEKGKLNFYIREVELAGVIKDAITSVLPMAKRKSIQINICNNCLMLSAMADQGRLRQVLVNLLSNAVKYSNNNSEIYIRSQLQKDKIKLEVQDSGCGIPKNKQHLLFNEFERAGAENTNVGGTGIGLMISRHMMEQMGGEIGFISEQGKGSCFWLLLPQAK